MPVQEERTDGELLNHEELGCDAKQGSLKLLMS